MTQVEEAEFEGDSDTAEDFVFDCLYCSIRTGFLPVSADQPLPCLLSSLCMTTGSMPSFCMNALHTGVCC